MIKKRIGIIYFCFLICAGFICTRIYIISTHGSNAQTVLSGQYSRKTDIASRAGFVFDKNKKMLGTYQNGYIVYVNPAMLEQSEINDVAKKLSEVSMHTGSYHTEKLLKGTPYTFTAQKKPDCECCKSFEKYEKETGPFLCHILGYVNADGKGISGLYGAYGDFLFDTDYTASTVFARYQADASGRCFSESFSEIFVSGYPQKEGIYLTIDSDIQRITENICDRDGSMQMGAVVICSADSGEILACVSRPSYDTGNVANYLDSKKGELINRAFSGFTPGSVFKIAVAAASLEQDPDSYDTEYECTGKITVADQVISCHKTDGHGKVTMREAFAHSCNPYFINLGLSLGTGKILDSAKKLGLRGNDKLNLLPVSSASLPVKNLHLPALCANTSIGQGELLCSPLEICSLVRTACTGNYKKPSVVSATSDGGNMTPSALYEENGILSQKTVETLKSLMLECVQNGTGEKARSETVSIAGKTATAQSGQKKNGKEILHSWFAGFFPYEDPKYVMCVMCDGNEKNKSAAEIFRNISEALTMLSQT